MATRPTSVSVIAWFLIVVGGISIVATTAMIGDPIMIEGMNKTPLPIPVQYAINYLGLMIMLISGIFMLKGKDWSRKLYVGWSLIGFAIGLATSPMRMMMIPGLVLFVVIAFFLFRPKANAFFAPSAPAENA